MESPVHVVTKAITDLWQENEKRHNEQQTVQEDHGKLLEELQSKISSLESKCQELSNHNAKLNEEIQLSKKRDDEKSDQIVQLKSEVEKQQISLKGYEKWEKLFADMADYIKGLADSNHHFEAKLNEIDGKFKDSEGQISRLESEMYKLAQARQRHSTSTTYRTPVKSATTSSFLNGNMHSTLPRSQPSFQRVPRPIVDPYEADEDFDELRDRAENLMRGVEELNDLQRSFEGNSFLSDT